MKLASPPSVFEALKAGARAAAAVKKSQNLSINKRKRKQKSVEPKPPIPENPLVNKGKGNPVEMPSNSVSVVQLDIQKSELKNPLAKKVEVDVNVDEFVSNLMKEPARFEPNSAAWWKDGDKVPFLFLAKAFDLIKGESGRIIITNITCNVLRTVIAKTPDDLLEVVYLLANKIAPAHQGLKLGIGDASLITALAQACGTSQDAVRISIG